MTHKSLLILLLVCSSLAWRAQDAKLEKKMAKIYKMADEGKVEDAGKDLEKLLEQNPGYGEGWDFLAKIKQYEYKQSKSMDNLFTNMEVTVKDKDGNVTKDGKDSAANALKKMLASIKPSDRAKARYFYALRKGILYSNTALESSYTLRNFFVDIDVDSAVSEKAMKYFDKAEEQFVKKNYAEAAQLYKKALDEQPDFFKASLYMGDCFYFAGEYTRAVEAFKAAKDRFPGFLEPRKYLVDAYGKKSMFTEAMNDCIETFAIYPDLSMYKKLEDLVEIKGKKFSNPWIPRGVFPLKFKNDSAFAPEDEFAAENANWPEPWKIYYAAGKLIQPYCNSKGIIVKPNNLTSSRYMEVFAWEEMLKKSKDPQLDAARKMQSEGVLDCYVLVNCFHVDFYEQYKDFAKGNKNRILDYYNRYLIK